MAISIGMSEQGHVSQGWGQSTPGEPMVSLGIQQTLRYCGIAIPWPGNQILKFLRDSLFPRDCGYIVAATSFSVS
jgi:hypothetical protein